MTRGGSQGKAGGAGVPWCPCPPPAAWSQGVSTGRWHKGPRRQPGQGTRPKDMTRTPTALSPGSARAGAGVGSSARQRLAGDRHSRPRTAAPWDGGAGMWDGNVGTGMAPHPVYKRWREETRSQGHVRQRLPWDQALLPAGTDVPKVLKQLPGDPSRSGSETPNERHSGARAARDPAGPSWGSVPPQSGSRGEFPPAVPCPRLRRVPARWRGGPRCRRQGEKRGISGLETRSRRCGAERSHAWPRCPRCLLGHSPGTPGPGWGQQVAP